MRLPPGPGRCRQRTAADAARFPESFPRPCPAGTSGGRSRPGPSPGVSVSGPGRSASRPRHLRRMARRLAVQAAPRRPDIPPPPRRPEVPFHSGRTFRLAQTEYSTRCRQAMLRTAGHSLRRGRHKKTGTAAHSLRRGRHKKTGRQPTLGPARGTGYRDASSCRRPAICGKISAQITRRTGTARQPGQPVVQI